MSSDVSIQKQLLDSLWRVRTYLIGLTWLRYLFLNGDVLYQKELEYTLPTDQIMRAELGLSMMLHNVREMEQLRSNLIYAIHTNDMIQIRA